MASPAADPALPGTTGPCARAHSRERFALILIQALLFRVSSINAQARVVCAHVRTCRRMRPGRVADPDPVRSRHACVYARLACVCAYACMPALPAYVRMRVCVRGSDPGTSPFVPGVPRHSYACACMCVGVCAHGPACPGGASRGSFVFFRGRNRSGIIFFEP